MLRCAKSKWKSQWYARSARFATKKIVRLQTDGHAEIRDRVGASIRISKNSTQPFIQIFVHVTRSVESRPRFDVADTNITLADDPPAGTTLATIRARFERANLGVSHPPALSYEIAEVEDVAAGSLLRVDSRSGALIVEAPLHEGVARDFAIVVSARVAGGLENLAIVRVHRAALNRHAPRFVLNPYTFEYSAQNDTIDDEPIALGRVYAFDIDEGENADVRYSLISVDASERAHFELDALSGELRLLGQRGGGGELPDEATLTVRASDSAAVAPLSDICTVYVRRRQNATAVAPPSFAS